MQGADTFQSEPTSARDASLLWRRQPLARTLALVAICLLAAAVPTDYLVAYALEADESFRAPSVYLSFGALLLSVRFLFGAGLGRRVAPILLVGGSIVAGMVSLLVLRWSGIGGGPLGRLDWPFRLAIISILFAYAASHARWRRPLIASYLGGWAAFVIYGLYLLAVGGADVIQHYDVERASLFGLDQNEQSVLVATGLVLLFDDMLVRGSFATVPLYLAAMLAGSVVFTSGVSRSGTFALACGLAVVLVGWMRRGTAHLTRRSFKLALVVALLCVGGVVIAQRNPLVAQAIDGLTQRMGDAFAGRDLGQRDALARETWRIALENPWHGVGFGRAQRYLGSDPHNGYLKILAEGGALAAVLLVAGLLLTGAPLARQVSRGRGAGPAGSLVVLLIWAAAGQALLELPFWFFLGVVVAGPEDDAP